jgi:hypothetical protein
MRGCVPSGWPGANGPLRHRITITGLRGRARAGHGVPGQSPINEMTGMTLLRPLSDFLCDEASAHKYKRQMKLHLRVQMSGTDSCACANADAQCAMPYGALCLLMVPPVGLEPTLRTLLGGRPLPLGYGGALIITQLRYLSSNQIFAPGASIRIGSILSSYAVA